MELLYFIHCYLSYYYNVIHVHVMYTDVHMVLLLLYYYYYYYYYYFYYLL
jgi:hypothetical protein